MSDPSQPMEFLGFEIMESKEYTFTKRQREKRKLIIRPNKNKILEKLLEKNIIMRQGDIMPYAVKDSKKHTQDLIKKKQTITQCVQKRYQKSIKPYIMHLAWEKILKASLIISTQKYTAYNHIINIVTNTTN